MKGPGEILAFSCVGMVAFVHDDDDDDDDEDLIFFTEKPAGYYVQRASGLFPAPYPQPPLPLLTKFSFLGTFIAKSLQVQ